MNKILLTTLAIISLTTAQASYIIKYPMEGGNGHLGAGSITFKNEPKIPEAPKGNWKPVDSIYTQWVKTGDLYGCSNLTPAASTVWRGVTFTQTYTDCKQDQSRTRQDREQEVDTLEYRNVGDLVTLTQTLTVAGTNTRPLVGTAACTYYIPNPYWNNYWETRISWMSGTAGMDMYTVYVNGRIARNTGGYAITSFDFEGVTYTRGNLIKNEGGFNFYEVCK